MASKRKDIEKLSLGALGLDPGQVGLSGARTLVTSAAARPQRTGGQVITPESPEDAARQIADFLQAYKFI